MTLQEFQNKYLGKQVEFHSYGSGAQNQCIDLSNQYIKEVLGLTPIIGTNAKDVGSKFNKDQFDWIVNTPEAIIQRGDIPVWNGNVGGGAGHIAIALEGGINSFKSLDQNWSQVERVTLENHNYNNVIGWLRPKGGVAVDNISIPKKTFEELVGKSTKYDNFAKAGFPTPEDVKKKIDDLTRQRDDNWNQLVAIKEELRVERTKTKGNPKAEALLKAVKDAVA